MQGSRPFASDAVSGSYLEGFGGPMSMPKTFQNRALDALGASWGPLVCLLGGLLGASYGHLGGVLGCPGASSGRLGTVCFSYHLPWDSMANRFWPCLPWNPMANAGQAIPQHNVYQFAMETAPAMDCHGISMANLSKIIHFQLLGPTCVCHGIPWQTGPTPTGPQTDPSIALPARKKRSKRKNYPSDAMQLQSA